MKAGARTLVWIGGLAGAVLVALMLQRGRAPGAVTPGVEVEARAPARADAPAAAVELSDAAGPVPARTEPGTPRFDIHLGGDGPALDPDLLPELLTHGRALDHEGRAIAGVAIVKADDAGRELARTAADGAFPLAEALGDYEELDIADEQWIATRQTAPRDQDGARAVLLLGAPRLALAGRVVDDDGAPLQARIEIEIDPTSFARFPELLDSARAPRRYVCTAGPDGTFALDAAAVDRAVLEATCDGHEPASMPAPTVARDDLALTLRRLAETSEVLVEGVVLQADGSPVARGEALVHLAMRTHEVDAAGRFSFRVSREIEESAALVAARTGQQAAIVPGFGQLVQAAQDRVAPQRLVLGPPTLSIEGRVVDATGRPQKGWHVQLLDPVVLVEGHIPPRGVEALTVASHSVPYTEDDGRFELRGLFDRSYRVQAHSDEALLLIQSEPVPAGARNVELVVPADARIAEVTGVVVGRDGSAVAGASVRAGLITFRTRNGYTQQHADAVTTDGEGRFALRDVPRRSATIDVGGDAVLPRTFPLEELDPDRPLRLEVARRCHFRVEGVPESARIAQIALRDARGDTTNIMRFQAGGSWTSSSVALEGGMTPVLAASEDARTLVFQGQDGAEVAARALALAPGEITVVRW